MESNNNIPLYEQNRVRWYRFTKGFLKFVNLHFTDNYFDIYEPIRKIYNRFKQTKSKKKIK